MGLAGSGSNTAGLAFGGNTTAVTGATEEWDVVTRGAWATGGSLNTARASLAGVGTQTAGLALVDIMEQLQFQILNLITEQVGLK
jgi:hypothetical protein